MKNARMAGTIGVALAVAAAVYLVFNDSYSSLTCSTTSTGAIECFEESSTLIEQSGAEILLFLALPIGVALTLRIFIGIQAPLVLEWSLAVLALVICLVALFSIGVFFLPAALAMITAVLLDKRTPEGDQPA